METAAGAVFWQRREVDFGLSSVNQLHGRDVGAQVGFDPAGVRSFTLMFVSLSEYARWIL
jgi:hypothetical protein